MVQKNVIAFSRNKAVAAAPVGIELCRPLPNIGSCNSLHRPGLAVLMVIGHASDIDPYALYRRVFFRTLGSRHQKVTSNISSFRRCHSGPCFDCHQLSLPTFNAVTP